MQEIIKQTEKLRRMIKANENKIDNPVLVTSIVSELAYFIEYIKE